MGGGGGGGGDCILIGPCILQRFNEPFSSDRVYFSMEVQVKLYRRVMYVFRKLLSEDSLVSSSKQEYAYVHAWLSATARLHA